MMSPLLLNELLKYLDHYVVAPCHKFLFQYVLPYKKGREWVDFSQEKLHKFIIKNPLAQKS